MSNTDTQNVDGCYLLFLEDCQSILHGTTNSFEEDEILTVLLQVVVEIVIVIITIFRVQ